MRKTKGSETKWEKYKNLKKLVIIFYWVQLLYGIVPNSVSIFIINVHRDDNRESVIFWSNFVAASYYHGKKCHALFSLYSSSSFFVLCFNFVTFLKQIFFIVLILAPWHINHDLYLYFPEYFPFSFW